jgi:AraC-like DNA-binding protein
MRATLVGLDRDRLARSCARPQDAIRLGAAAPGVELAEARFTTPAFEPHRHDTYAVGITVAGVQTFHYRGARRVCLPGELHVLHPDELHDGAPATPRGFAYRIAYLEPALLHEALGGGPLPFVRDPVPRRSAATAAVAALLADIDEPIDELRRSVIAATLADALCALGGRRPAAAAGVDRRALELVRERLAADPRAQAPAAELEHLCGLDRFALARQFRRAFGTSPDRYRTMRRLELARAAIRAGAPLGRAAVEAGFADQSHLTRQFKRAYGLTPGRFAQLTVTSVPIGV